MAHPGNYQSEKIRAAAELALFDRTSDAAQRGTAVAHLRRALDHWKRHSSAYALEYKQPRLCESVGWVNLAELAAKVEQEIGIAESWPPGSLSDKAGPRQADTPFRKCIRRGGALPYRTATRTSAIFGPRSPVEARLANFSDGETGIEILVADVLISRR